MTRDRTWWPFMSMGKNVTSWPSGVQQVKERVHNSEKVSMFLTMCQIFSNVRVLLMSNTYIQRIFLSVYPGTYRSNYWGQFWGFVSRWFSLRIHAHTHRVPLGASPTCSSPLTECSQDVSLLCFLFSNCYVRQTPIINLPFISNCQLINT